MYYIRYADDYLACFQNRGEAEAFLKEMKERLEKFSLEIEESKTKLIQFGRFAEQNVQARGGEPEQFEFLGFTHYCGKTRYGAFKVKRKTSKKKYRTKLKEAKEWLKKERNQHHIGYGSSCPSRKRSEEIAKLPASAQTVVKLIGAFGEGFAMLAAAGDPDVHPHAVSSTEDRALGQRHGELQR